MLWGIPNCHGVECMCAYSVCRCEGLTKLKAKRLSIHTADQFLSGPELFLILSSILLCGSLSLRVFFSRFPGFFVSSLPHAP